MKMHVHNITLIGAFVVSSFLIGWGVDANQSSDDLIVKERFQDFLEEEGKVRDTAFIRDIYEKTYEAIDDSTHPYVRSELWKLTQWMEENYAFAGKKTLTSTNSNKFIRSNGEVVTRAGSSIALTHGQLIAKYGEHAVAPSRVPPTVSSSSIDTDTSTMISEKEVMEQVVFNTASTEESDDRDEWYVLKKGRINVSLLRASWLRWVNDFREEEGVESKIVHQPLLDKTATERSYKMRSDGTRSHKRTPESVFYDYGEIDQWFKDRGLTFANVNRATHTENVGQSSLYCDEEDCTEEAKESLYRVFEYFINEKGQVYDAHYRTIIQPYFREMGFGIAVDEDTGLIYSTMHYGTEAKRSPGRISAR